MSFFLQSLHNRSHGSLYSWMTLHDAVNRLEVTDSQFLRCLHRCVSSLPSHCRQSQVKLIVDLSRCHMLHHELQITCRLSRWPADELNILLSGVLDVVRMETVNILNNVEMIGC